MVITVSTRTRSKCGGTALNSFETQKQERFLSQYYRAILRVKIGEPVQSESSKVFSPYRFLEAIEAVDVILRGVKGIVLAGGTGSRLFPLTKITNKHLLPIYDKPMVYYPIQTLVEAGITDIMLVTGGRNSGDFLRLLGNGKEFGLKHLNYTYQEGEGGIAEALALTEHFADGDQVCVILGDNLIEGNIRAAVDEVQAAGTRRADFPQGSFRRRAFRRSGTGWNAHRGHRGETEASEKQLRGHRNLSLRRYRVRKMPGLETLRARRARNYGRK